MWKRINNCWHSLNKYLPGLNESEQLPVLYELGNIIARAIWMRKIPLGLHNKGKNNILLNKGVKDLSLYTSCNIQFRYLILYLKFCYQKMKWFFYFRIKEKGCRVWSTERGLKAQVRQVWVPHWSNCSQKTSTDESCTRCCWIVTFELC